MIKVLHILSRITSCKKTDCSKSVKQCNLSHNLLIRAPLENSIVVTLLLIFVRRSAIAAESWWASSCGASASASVCIADKGGAMASVHVLSLARIRYKTHDTGSRYLHVYTHAHDRIYTRTHSNAQTHVQIDRYIFIDHNCTWIYTSWK